MLPRVMGMLIDALMAQGITASSNKTYCSLMMPQFAIVGMADGIASCSAGVHWNAVCPCTGGD